MLTARRAERHCPNGRRSHDQSSARFMQNFGNPQPRRRRRNRVAGESMSFARARGVCGSRGRFKLSGRLTRGSVAGALNEWTVLESIQLFMRDSESAGM